MSYITAPDPFPGRCRNHRAVPFTLESLRCLDYEGTEHVCRFPEPPPNTPQVGRWAQSNTVTPKPWVRPENLLGASQENAT